MKNSEIISAVGVICEYNPFHNGHAYHLRKTREAFPEAYIICVMSGTFTQRGDVAIIGPSARARMALANGADCVFELPALFAVRDARTFARGGVALLDRLNVCAALSFGCEDEEALRLALDALEFGDSDPAASLRLREGLDRGESFARARGLPNMPNVILGAQYIRSIREINSNMKPLAIKRAAVDGAGGVPLSPAAPIGGIPPATAAVTSRATAIASASRIREILREISSPDGLTQIARLIPHDVYEYITATPSAMRSPDALDALLLGTLRGLTSTTIAQAAEATEGIERRIAACASRAVSRANLIELIKCKRYTYTHISRILTQTLLGVTKSLAAAHPLPEYARLLGFRRSAAPLLRAIQDNASIPIVTRPADFRRQNNPAFALDLHAHAIAALACADESMRRGDDMLTEGVAII